MTRFSLDGKVALVTGSSRGIGKAMATAFAEHGAKVVISSRKADACEAVAAELRAAGHQAIAVACHVGQDADIQALVERTVANWGRIDVLVCNAGTNPHFGPLAGIPRAAYDKVMDVNLRSNLLLCNHVMPGMATRREGSVIIISSIAGVRGSAVIGAYGISKAAGMALARNLAVEWGPSNLRVNCIAPGVVRTELARARWEDPEIHAKVVAAYPLGRIGEPEDIAGAAVFLASPASAWMTGQTLFVDGGVTIAGG